MSTEEKRKYWREQHQKNKLKRNASRRKLYYNKSGYHNQMIKLKSLRRDVRLAQQRLEKYLEKIGILDND
jgi:hypothetical protein